MNYPPMSAMPDSTPCRVLVHVIRNALTVPPPASDRDELTYLRVCRDRAWLVIAACGRILGDREAGDRDLLIAAEALRNEVADYPPEGYEYAR